MEDTLREAYSRRFLDTSFLDTSWQSEAACKGMDTNIFFPLQQAKGQSKRFRTARAVCATCSVQNNCLEYAVQANERLGIWGGTVRHQRTKIREFRRQQAAR